MTSMLRDFKEFAVKGNVLDMAVGIIIGAAFGTVVQSLVRDVLTPPMGLLAGGVDFADLFLTLREGASPGPYATLADAQAVGAVTVNVGVFLNAVISFVLVSFAVFALVRAYNRLQREAEAAEEAAADEPAPPSREETLLTEIRDLLASRA